MNEPRKLGIAGRLGSAWINSKLTPLVIGGSLLLGVFSVLMLPREEEPQIIVPMIDLFVQMPGAPAHEVEQRVTRPMEKLLWEVPGVEYVYSTTMPGSAMVVVRFKVGEDEKVSQKLLDLSGKPARKGRYGTVCYIRKGRSIVTGGVAIVHPKDKFDVETGRKLSLAQALQEVGTKAVRKLFWKKYFGQ